MQLRLPVHRPRLGPSQQMPLYCHRAVLPPRDAAPLETDLPASACPPWLQEYTELYLGPKDGGVTRIYERVSDRWEVCIATTEGQFNQVGGPWAGQEAGR